MIGFLKRLFVITPIAIVLMLLILTLIVPFGYYLVTGKDYVEDVSTYLRNL